MQIDVSDIFDDFYDVAMFARRRFELAQSLDGESDEWDRFCRSLNDSLFLPAVANRAFQLTHASLSPSEAKRRIITERRTREGDRIFYCRYLYPIFNGTPSFYSDHEVSSSPIWSFTRPVHLLTLWLGELPPSQVAIEVPPYPDHLDLPVRYFAHSYSTIMSKSPLVDYYEVHGDWCLRRIQQDGPRFVRAQPNGAWTDTSSFREITKEWFDRMWSGAAGKDCDA